MAAVSSGAGGDPPGLVWPLGLLRVATSYCPAGGFRARSVCWPFFVLCNIYLSDHDVADIHNVQSLKKILM